MVTEFSSCDIQVVSSRNHHPVCVFRGQPLHCLIDPVREAQDFISKNKELLLEKNRVLILGLGFAYHVVEAIKCLEERFGKDFEMIVVEPSLEVAQDCLTRNLLNDERVTVFSKKSVSALYDLEAFTQALLKGVTVLTHPRSLDIHEVYFKEFLSYRSSSRVEDFVGRVESSSLRTYLEQHFSQKDFSEVLEIKTAKRKEDFLLKALGHMVNA